MTADAIKDIHQILILRASPSLNEFSYAMSPFVQSQSKKEWFWLLRCAPGVLAIPHAKGKRHLTIERHGKKALDPDNLIGGAKCCITDNLKKLKLIVDDSDSSLLLDAKNVALQPGEKPHTILILRDI